MTVFENIKKLKKGTSLTGGWIILTSLLDQQLETRSGGVFLEQGFSFLFLVVQHIALIKHTWTSKSRSLGLYVNMG